VALPFNRGYAKQPKTSKNGTQKAKDSTPLWYCFHKKSMPEVEREMTIKSGKNFISNMPY